MGRTLKEIIAALPPRGRNASKLVIERWRPRSNAYVHRPPRHESRPDKQRLARLEQRRLDPDDGGLDSEHRCVWTRSWGRGKRPVERFWTPLLLPSLRRHRGNKEVSCLAHCFSCPTRCPHAIEGRSAPERCGIGERWKWGHRFWRSGGLFSIRLRS